MQRLELNPAHVDLSTDEGKQFDVVQHTIGFCETVKNQVYAVRHKYHEEHLDGVQNEDEGMITRQRAANCLMTNIMNTLTAEVKHLLDAEPGWWRDFFENLYRQSRQFYEQHKGAFWASVAALAGVGLIGAAIHHYNYGCCIMMRLLGWVPGVGATGKVAAFFCAHPVASALTSGVLVAVAAGFIIYGVFKFIDWWRGDATPPPPEVRLTQEEQQFRESFEGLKTRLDEVRPRSHEEIHRLLTELSNLCLVSLAHTEQQECAVCLERFSTAHPKGMPVHAPGCQNFHLVHQTCWAEWQRQCENTPRFGACVVCQRLPAQMPEPVE